jgi:hypothetical protein
MGVADILPNDRSLFTFPFQIYRVRTVVMNSCVTGTNSLSIQSERLFKTSKVRRNLAGPLSSVPRPFFYRLDEGCVPGGC